MREISVEVAGAWFQRNRGPNEREELKLKIRGQLESQEAGEEPQLARSMRVAVRRIKQESGVNISVGKWI